MGIRAASSQAARYCTRADTPHGSGVPTYQHPPTFCNDTDVASWTILRKSRAVVGRNLGDVWYLDMPRPCRSCGR